ncbi:hypothetical protein [Herbaspirillum sp. SJZ099]|uniref:hypothetical protein n=1 Tax=Herbaspirillum sp. SJZ099 TaxID=2572916 RepID=UPI0011A5880A|nr:hypothetical protein [Herbaspirillum sp. SJZ099]
MGASYWILLWMMARNGRRIARPYDRNVSFQGRALGDLGRDGGEGLWEGGAKARGAEEKKGKYGGVAII